MTIGITLVAFDKMSRVIGDAIGKSTQHLTEFQKKVKSVSESMALMGTASMISGQAVLAQTGKLVDAFMEIEDAQTGVTMASLREGGVAAQGLAALHKEAKSLGDLLPGTTADFERMADLMIRRGIEIQDISGGALRAASYLGLVIKEPYEKTAVWVSELKNSMNIASKDLVNFMDTYQRAVFMGANPEEMQFAFSRSAGILKPTHIQGLQAAKEITPIFALLSKQGYQGERMGTGFANIITGVMNHEKLAKANAELAKYGEQLSFVDNAGNFAGIPNLIIQLDKLKSLNQTAKMSVMTALLGTGGDEKIALTLIEEGIEGYNKQVDAMARQANLQQKITEALKTLRNVWEAFTGTLRNALAIIGGSMAPTLKYWADKLNNLAARLGNFAEKHELLMRILSVGTGVIGGSLVFLGGLGIALSIIGRSSLAAIHGLGSMLRLMRSMIQITGILTYRMWSWIASINFVAIAQKIAAFATGLWSGVMKIFNLVMSMNPIGLVIIGIAALIAIGYVFYKNWDKIVKFLGTSWNWLKQNWQKLLQVFLWISPVTMPFMVLQKLVKWLFGIDLFQAGKNIIMSIWRGMMAFINKPLEAMKSLAQRIRNFLPFSPAKEGPLRDLNKMNFGGNITDSLNKTSLPALRGGTGASGGSVVVHYAPVIHLSGDLARAKDDFVALLRKHKDEIARIVASAAGNKPRVAY